jgi:hypothetical protein
MLNNLKWDRRQPTILSVEGLIAWLEQQLPETEYNFSSNTDCLLSRYFIAMGIDVCCVVPGFYNLESTPEESIPYPEVLNDIAMYGSPTYGGALTYARKAKKGEL